MTQRGRIFLWAGGSLALLTLLVFGVLQLINGHNAVPTVREVVISDQCTADDVSVHRVDSIRWCRATTASNNYTVTFKETPPVLGSPASTTSALPLSVDPHAAFGDYPYSITRYGEQKACVDPVVHVVPDVQYAQLGSGQKCH